MPHPSESLPGESLPGEPLLGTTTGPSGPRASEAGGPSAVADLAVAGMHCDSCATLIEEVLAEQVGVRTASVDLERARARVEYDPSRLGVEDLTEAVAGAGYSATPSASA